MPIIKERLLDLINAGERIESIYIDTCQTVLNNCLRARKGEQSDRETLDLIEQILAGFEVQIFASSRVIFKERTWYNLTRRKAERAQAYQERRRREAGIMPQPLSQPQLRHITQYERQIIPENDPGNRIYLRNMEALGIQPKEALDILERHRAQEDIIPAAAPADPLAPQAAFEPSVEDTEGWALPTADDDEEPPA